MSTDDLEEATAQLATMMQAFVNAQQVAVKEKQDSKWDASEKYRNVKCFGGKQDDWEEWSMKVLGQIGAGCPRARILMKHVAEKLTERLIQCIVLLTQPHT